jgi:hypothetical protein
MSDFEKLFRSDDLTSHGGVVMGREEVLVEIGTGTVETGANGENAEISLPFVEEAMEDIPARVTYLLYLKSPVITLLVGHGEDQALLTAHQALLTQSPWFAEVCAKFSNEVSVRAPPPAMNSEANSYPQERRIDLIDEDLDAMGCFLEYLYTGDYFPRRVGGTRNLERDASVPEVDETGDQLLKHARVYTLAETFSLPGLKSLASSKIHCVNSTAQGEIAYARYIYANTQKEDAAIRGPVMNFWATRSHTLRAEAEDEFRQMCLEFPQFGYDVLSKLIQRCFGERDGADPV